MKKLLELRQQKAELVDKSKSILTKAETENRSISSDEAKQAKAINLQISDINTHIESAELLAEEERSLISGQQGRKTDQPTNAELRAFVRTGETRALSIGSATDGGHTVVPHLDKQIGKQLRENVVMMANAKNVTISTQEYKELISVGGFSSTWAGEGDTRTETNTSKLEPVVIKVGNLFAYPSASNEVLDHSDFNIEQWLISEISEEFTQALETATWNGNGTNKPKGLLTVTRAMTADGVRAFGQIQEVITAGIAKTDFDDLITLVHSLKPAYRKKAKFYMSDAMAEKLRKLKNAQGDYVWRDAMVEGQPDTLLGKAVEITDEIPANEIVFADMSRAYTVVSHSMGNRMLKDMITKPGISKLITDNYFGGGARDTNAVKIMKEKA